MLSLEIGSALDLSEKDMETLNFSSLLHDIGKIGIPEQILNKTEKLTDDEWNKIKEHPLKGYNILVPIKQLKDCLPAILSHHERINKKNS